MTRRTKANEDLGYFSEWQLVCILGDLWSAGMETTANTMSFGILLMMYHPDVQGKVRNEIESVIGFDQMPSMNDRVRMPYTNAVIQEIQRFANILAVNLQHTVNKDIDILGYRIPKGISILPQISVVHLDDTLYENPRKFNPDRFLESDGVTPKKTEHLLPFSLGKRICLGESLARMELFLIFTSLMQKFCFSFVENQPKPSLQAKLGFISSPNPYTVCVSRSS